MTKTAFSLFLALLMVFGMGFLAAPQAHAAEATAHADHCVCGGKAVGVGNHTACTTLTDWIALSTDAEGNLLMGDTTVPTYTISVDGTNMSAYLLPAGNFYLTADITLKYPLNAGARNAADSAWVTCVTTLCLNGHDLAGSGATGATGRAFTLRAGNSTLNITDCAETTGTISSSVQGAIKGGVFYIRFLSTTLNIYGGIIQGCTNNTTSTMNGGAIAMYTGTVNMYGGQINGGSGKMTAGAVYMDYSYNSSTGRYDGSSTFNLYGGTIVGGDVSLGGGAVRINQGKHVFNVYGGTIRDGKAGSLGGNILAFGTLNVYGGTISGGTATQRGGNILADSQNVSNGTAVGSVNIYGGTISGGTDSIGAGIWVNAGKKYNVTGGTINSAVYIESNKTLTLNADLNAQIKLGTAAKTNIAIDLNGHDLSGSISGAYKVFGIDSATKDFSGTNYGILSSTIDAATTLITDCTQPTFDAETTHIYVPLSEETGWSFHAVYLGVSDADVQMDADGNVDVCYTTYVKSSSKVAPLISGDSAYGLKIYLLESNSRTAGASAASFVAGADGNEVTVLLTDVMTVNGQNNAAKALALVKAKAYVVINGTTIEGPLYSNDLQSIVEALDEEFDLLRASRQMLLADMYTEYTSDMINWVIPNIKEAADLPATTISEAEEALLRQQAEAYMRQICSIQWTVAEDTVLSCGSTCHSDVSLTAGTVYTGMPYSHYAASLEKFQSRMNDSGVLVLDSDALAGFGNDCADSVYWAWSQISSGITFTLTKNTMCYNGTIPVGDYIVTGQLATDDNGTKAVCELNGAQTMYEAYAQLKMGDAVLWAPGHIRMVAANAVVVRNDDGTVNANDSYVLIHEQGTSRTPTTSCAVDSKITFAKLFSTNYIPITIAAFTQGADAEQVFACNAANATLDEMATTGYITSNYRINSMTLKVTDASNNTLADSTVFPFVGSGTNGNVVNLSVFQDVVDSLTLTSGSQYTYEIIVHVGDADVSAQTVTFTAA